MSGVQKGRGDDTSKSTGMQTENTIEDLKEMLVLLRSIDEKLEYILKVLREINLKE